MRTAGASLLLLLAASGGLAAAPREEVRSGSALVELGRRLFFDESASRAGKVACAGCHDPRHGWSDPRVRSEDAGGATARHSQPILDIDPKGALHWDGEFGSLRELLVARVAPAAEALEQARALLTRGFEDSAKSGRAPDALEFSRRLQSLAPPYYGADVSEATPLVSAPAERIEREGRYREAFTAAFGSERPTTERMIRALEAFVLSIRSGRSAFDRFREGEPGALDASARRGLALFTGRANCASCHPAQGGPRPDFSDGKFHDTGVEARGSDRDPGRAAATFVASDRRAYKTPSLRDVARRAPYMHDGSFPSLEEVVRYYAEGGTPHPGLDPLLRPLRLDEEDVRDLVAFLRSLSGGGEPGSAPAAASPRRASIRLIDPAGIPVAGLRVRVEPMGQPLGGGAAFPAPVEAQSDAGGRLEFEFPAATHARLVSPTHEIAGDRLLPDTLRYRRLVAAPRDRAWLTLRTKGAGSPPREVRVEERSERRGVTTVTFERVRMLGLREAVYVSARRPEEPPLVGTLSTGAIVAGPYEVDLSGGMAEPIDLGAGR